MRTNGTFTPTELDLIAEELNYLLIDGETCHLAEEDINMGDNTFALLCEDPDFQ